MKVELFLACEGAFCHDGNLTIVGTFNVIKANTFPYKLNVGIALQLSFNDQSEWNEQFKINIYKGDDENALYTIEGYAPKKQEGKGRLALVANIQGLLIPEESNYRMLLFLGDTEKAEYDFNVVAHGK